MSEAEPLELGAFHTLEVVEDRAAGVLLGDAGILLPRKQVPEGTQVGAQLEVFVYEGPNGRPVATTRQPHAKVGEFGYLRVVDRSDLGAFVDWGLDKDLLVPRNEQYRPLSVGRRYMVAVTTDARGRVMGSNRIREFLDDDTSELSLGQEVRVVPFELHERGMRVIVDGRWEGMIFHDDIYERMRIGDELQGRISKIRPDGKVDVALRARGEKGRAVGRGRLEEALEAAGGFLPLHDKSDPEDIQRTLSMSKKAFKRAVGNLYKAGRLELTDDGIRLIGSDEGD